LKILEWRVNQRSLINNQQRINNQRSEITNWIGRMNRNVWLVAGLVVIALGLLNVVLGMNLVPTMSVATERGTIAGWWLIWVVISLVVISAVSLGGFLVAAGLGKVPETRAK
jgi:hypothetical protein